MRSSELAKITYVLHSDEVRANEWNVVDLAEHLHHTAVVDARDEDGQEVCQESRLLLQVERESLVVAATTSQMNSSDELNTHSHLDVGDLDDDLLELVVLPAIGRALNHGESGVILDHIEHLYHR